jgi:hypothetical protein
MLFRGAGLDREAARDRVREVVDETVRSMNAGDLLRVEQYHGFLAHERKVPLGQREMDLSYRGTKEGRISRNLREFLRRELFEFVGRYLEGTVKVWVRVREDGIVVEGVGEEPPDDPPERPSAERPVHNDHYA